MPAPPRLPLSAGSGTTDVAGNVSLAAAAKPQERIPDLRLDPTSASVQTVNKNGCFHLRHVHVPRLLADGTLGLLLHGTTVVGFYSPEAESAGWCTNDQIVQINGRNVADFEDFQRHFGQAQEEGFPFDFGVLRRENVASESSRGGAADKTLASFFNEHSVADLAGQLERKFGQTPAPARADGHVATSASIWSATTGTSDEEDKRADQRVARSPSITDNPYIQALRRQRDELFRGVEAWRSEMADSVASRLATQRSDGLATLTTPTAATAPTPRMRPGLSESSPLNWGSCLNTGVDQLPCGLQNSGEVCSRYQHELTPSPGVEHEMESLRGSLDELHAWAGFASPQKDATSQKFATSLLPIATPARAR